MERIAKGRRYLYRSKLQTHKLSMDKLAQLTRRLPQPDDAEIQDTIVLDLIEGKLDDVIEQWVEFFDNVRS